MVFCYTNWDRTYQATISVANHNSNNGHYSAHIYGQSSITGGLIGLAVTSGFDNVDTRPNATVSVVNYSENKTTFDVVVTGSSATKTITSVAIAVWSEDKGQDDLIWYTPTITNNSARVTIDMLIILTHQIFTMFTFILTTLTVHVWGKFWELIKLQNQRLKTM